MLSTSAAGATLLRIAASNDATHAANVDKD
jgi:hypothetical protein